jgi:hypothetical protein
MVPGGKISARESYVEVVIGYLPGSTVLLGPERVGSAATRRDGTFCHPVRSILVVAIELPDSVPVERRAVSMSVLHCSSRRALLMPYPLSWSWL